jgi:hypothetical protein
MVVAEQQMLEYWSIGVLEYWATGFRMTGSGFINPPLTHFSSNPLLQK